MLLYTRTLDKSLFFHKTYSYFELCPGLSSTHPSGEVEDDQLLVVSAVMPGATDLVPGFIRSVATHLPDATINLIDLGVSRYILPKLFSLFLITHTISPVGWHTLLDTLPKFNHLKNINFFR